MAPQHRLDLRNVVFQQVAAEPAHPFGGFVLGIHAGAVGDDAAHRLLRGLAAHLSRLSVQFGGIDEPVGLHLARGTGHVDPDRVGIGIQPDKQEGDRIARAVPRLDRCPELAQPVVQRVARGIRVTAMGGAALVERIQARKVIDSDLEVARRRVGRVRVPRAPAAKLHRLPVAQRPRHAER